MPPLFKRPLSEKKKPVDKKKIPKKKKEKLVSYRSGGEGMIRWCEDNVCVPIYPPGSVIPVWTLLGELPSEPNPTTGKSYKGIWEAQKEILREALKMDENGRFIHRLIIFCWQRGEGKSLVACFIQLWKYFCWPRQQIMLGANSKDQVKFVHYDIMRDIIVNSPKLLYAIGGKVNVREKEIRMKDSDGNIRSIIRSISSFSGIVSNITGYTFSEIFDMKNPRFFVQLDGSIRNIPNALGVIDSTVSDKNHVLYKQYQNWLRKTTSTIYFSYRCSRTGDMEDYWNPNMDQAQLDDYRAKFPFGEFERYFLNLWEAGKVQVFSDVMIEATKCMGVKGETLLDYNTLKPLIEKKYQLKGAAADFMNRSNPAAAENCYSRIVEIDEKIVPVSNYYSLGTLTGTQFMPVEMLNNLGDMFETDWAVLSGLDMADPMAVSGRARTIMTLLAKGLVGSRDLRRLLSLEAAPKYIYFLLYAAHIEGDSVDKIKDLLEEGVDEYSGIDVLCAERYGTWDMSAWCEEHAIRFEPIFPTYDRQRDAFKELYSVVKESRLKRPPVPIHGVKKEDILDEELGVFMHDQDKRWFGSPEKKEKYGVQDDFVYSLGWCMFGGRNLSIDDFRPRSSNTSFGYFIENKALHGVY